MLLLLMSGLGRPYQAPAQQLQLLLLLRGAQQRHAAIPLLLLLLLLLLRLGLEAHQKST